ncbi:M13 family metallopeptidase [Moheibacter lacus]|uniref:M13 family metallopeptidase n=1 Tax=Moheibacter lacus TaxID=2745851 RepID=A0A838ZGX5_9FLAO|nr:M13 family metallopeptidase [Moheibacter lacus]MBA5628518.1 M13 family metallopeptidase [Moheibacter lacus]
MKKQIFLGLSLIGCLSFGQNDFHAVKLEFMDNSVRPQDDFYNFVNGNWMKTTEIPSDRARWGSFDELRENTDVVSLNILKGLLGQNHPKGSDQQKIGDIYESYVDFDSRDKAGLKPIQPYLNKIDKIKSVKDLETYLAEVTPIGLNSLYGFYVRSHMKNSSQNAVYLGDADLGMGRNYYQKEDENNKKSLEQYSAYIDKIYHFTAEKTRDLKGPKIIGFEKEIASTLFTIEELRDDRLQFNPYAVKDLKNLSKNIDLAKFIGDLGVKTDSVIIGEINYFKKLDQIINEKNIPIIKQYLKFHLINGATGYLTKELDELNFDFYGRQLRGQKEQRSLDKRGLEYVNRSAGELLGKIYVKDNFPPEAKANAKEMIDYLFKSFRVHINDLEWMSAETKVKAIEKLNKFTVKIGYPDKWKDYSNLEIVSHDEEFALFKNQMNLRKWRYDYMFNKIGKPVDRTEWGMSPQTVNAYFNPSNNEIVFPAAILQYPFYDYRADAAVNFGGIGAVIGHEVSHGFDDSGAMYDGDGNLKNWWTEEDFTKFNAAGEALANQYSQYEPVKETFVNGKFTLGENIGDLGGLNVAYDALLMYLKDKGNPGKIDGFTQEQRFFISWATIWRTKSTDAALINQVKTDPHSPGYFRAIGPLENIEGFYKAFDVKKGDKMFKPQSERIIIW